MSTKGVSFLIYLARGAARPLDPRQLRHWQQCFHGKNGQITCPVRDTYPIERGAMGRICLLVIISLVILLSIKIELKQFYWNYAPTQKIWKGFLQFLLLLEVKIVAEQKQA